MKIEKLIISETCQPDGSTSKLSALYIEGFHLNPIYIPIGQAGLLKHSFPVRIIDSRDGSETFTF